MSDHKQQTVQIVVQFLQLVMLVIGVAGVFMEIGSKGERLTQNTTDIRELRDIAQDLLRTTVEVKTSDRAQEARLDDIRARLTRLEDARD
jgi:predicted  nucleic acid-binding Zn-ribbon protein